MDYIPYKTATGKLYIQTNQKVWLYYDKYYSEFRWFGAELDAELYGMIEIPMEEFERELFLEVL